MIKERYTPFRADGHGRRLHFESADFRELKAPFDHQRIAMVGFMSEKQAFENLETLAQTHTEGRVPAPFERAEILRRAAGRVRDRHDFFSDLIAWEGGKPLKDAKVEVTRAINSLEIAAEECVRWAGREIPMRGTKAAEGHLAFTTPEPIGVVFAISAFNHPLNLIAHQVGPAIAVGCPVLVKPASETPLSCLHLLDELYEAGLPPEMALPLVCENEVTEKIAKSPKVAFLTFIGSARVGWYLRSVVAPGTRVSLEHGGSAPAIVDASADLDLAVPSLIRAGYYHSGQVCVSAQRVFVHQDVWSEFTERFVGGAQALKVGDARKPETDCGPIIRLRDRDRIHDRVTHAVAHGAQLMLGGEKVGASCYAATVLSHAQATDPIMREEIFGPVVNLLPFTDFEHAIKCANDVEWQFQSAIYSCDLDRAMTAARRFRASAAMINESTAFRVDWMPFRGDGPSGLGTGGIAYTMHDMTKEKMILMRIPRA